MTTNSPELQQRLRALADLIPIVEAPGFSFGHWAGGERTASGAIQVPYVEPDAGGMLFVNTIGRSGWLRPDFDWPTWSRTAEFEALRTQPEALQRASAEQLAWLLTTLVRADRFNEGVLLEAWDTGLLLRVLRRAQTLLDELA